MQIPPRFERVLHKARIARLATVDSKYRPHLIPVVFVFCNDLFYLPIDHKSKRARPEKLKRVRNIQQNSNVALLIDRYSENWKELFYILIQGKASILGNKYMTNHEKSLSHDFHILLREKYKQYEKIGVGEYIIMIKPQKAVTWSNV